MARIVLERDGIGLHPREDLIAIGVLAAVNSEVILNIDGCTSVAIDLRATGITGSPVVFLEGTVDGTNYEAIPVLRRDTKVFLVNNAIGAGSSILIADVSGYRKIRQRVVTAPTAGTYTSTLRATNSDYLALSENIPATVLGAAVGAAGAAVTLTLAAPATGLFHHITRLSITRFASALLTAGAAPVTITTGNMPGALAFSVPAEAAAQGTVWEKEIDFTQPIKAVAAATATTFVCPVTTGVLWRVTAYGYLGA